MYLIATDISVLPKRRVQTKLFGTPKDAAKVIPSELSGGELKPTYSIFPGCF